MDEEEDDRSRADNAGRKHRGFVVEMLVVPAVVASANASAHS
jgi:hypothetical protein